MPQSQTRSSQIPENLFLLSHRVGAYRTHMFILLRVIYEGFSEHEKLVSVTHEGLTDFRELGSITVTYKGFREPGEVHPTHSHTRGGHRTWGNSSHHGFSLV